MSLLLCPSCWVPMLRNGTDLSRGRIFAHAGGCEGFAAGRAPNFVLLDFVNLGEGAKAVDQLNGLA